MVIDKTSIYLMGMLTGDKVRVRGVYAYYEGYETKLVLSPYGSVVRISKYIPN
jgi:hypothetical protein